MRTIFGWVRISEEPWENTMRRMALRVNNVMGQSKLKHWSTRLAESQWKFVARLKQLPASSWPSRAAYWQPKDMRDVSCDFIPYREPGGQYTKWNDRVSKFCWNYFGKKLQDVPNLSFLRALPIFVSSY